MSKRRYFGTDGIRGRVGQVPITPEFMLKLGWATGQVLSPDGGGKVLIGKDTRISGYMFESALEAGFAAAGVDIHLLGPLPTPGIAYLTRTQRASAGLVISASHNAFEDNGVKFFSGAGVKLPDDVELRIEAALDKPLRMVGSAELGRAKRVEDANGRYIEFCKASFPGTVSLAGLKVVLDCAHGATYQTAPAVFNELGARVTVIGAQPDGFNINRDCGSTACASLRAEVLAAGADVGIAFDGDGDRVLMVDAHGKVVDGDQILYVIARDRMASGMAVPGVVGTLMTNLGLEHALAEAGVTLHRTAVGDRYVMARLQAEGLLLGGENSGHVICLDRNTTGDGIVSALQVLAAMTTQGKGLADLVAGMHKYPQIIENVQVADKEGLVCQDRVRNAMAHAERRLAGNGRVLLRPSGTEPVVRVMCEGQDAVLVRQIVEELVEVIARAA